MMRLRRVEEGVWTILAVCDERGSCQVRDFLRDLMADSRPDYEQIMALLERTAMSGPPKDEKRSRSLGDDIFELKTRGGIRVLYFYDEDRLIICAQAARKPKKAQLRADKGRAIAARAQYFTAKQLSMLHIQEEP